LELKLFTMIKTKKLGCSKTVSWWAEINLIALSQTSTTVRSDFFVLAYQCYRKPLAKYYTMTILHSIFLLSFSFPMTTIHAYAAHNAWWPLEKFTYELWEIWYDQVDVIVDFCGICHSDLSMLNNDWGMTHYPFVPWHEIIGRVDRMWAWVKHLKVWQKVWIWRFSGSCHVCDQCVSGDQNICNKWEGIIVWRHGWFANKVRVQDKWAFALPDSIDASSAW
jgi:hypothetical protein